MMFFKLLVSVVKIIFLMDICMTSLLLFSRQLRKIRIRKSNHMKDLKELYEKIQMIKTATLEKYRDKLEAAANNATISATMSDTTSIKADSMNIIAATNSISENDNSPVIHSLGQPIQHTIDLTNELTEEEKNDMLLFIKMNYIQKKIVKNILFIKRMPFYAVKNPHSTVRKSYSVYLPILNEAYQKFVL